MFSDKSRALGFWTKPIVAAGLVAIADQFFYGQTIGTTLGAFALLLILVAALIHPAMRRDRRALVALSGATIFALILVDEPSLLGWALFWIALGVALLSPRATQLDDARQWAQRLAVFAVAGIAAPALDAYRAKRQVTATPPPWPAICRFWSCPWSAAACSSCCSPRPIR